MDKKINIIKNGEKIGEIIENSNPIQSDEDCLKMLELISSRIQNLTDTEQKLIALCKAVVSAAVEEILSFNFIDLIEFTTLSDKYSDFSQEIIYCAEHINNVCDFEGDICREFYLDVAQTYGCLIPSIQMPE